MSLESFLSQITDEDAPLHLPALVELSDLSSGDLERYARVWSKLASERKQKVMESLVELAEDSSELDFSGIFKLCLKDSDELVREKAVTGLWEFEDRSIIVSLVDILQYDNSGRVRESAAKALGKFASLAEEGKILPRDGDLVRERLMEVLQNEKESLDVRRRALESVAPFNTPAINEHIRWAYESDNTELQCSSLYAMGRTGESRWLAVLVNELQSPSTPIRYEAANACGELNDEDAAPHLIPLLQDDDLQVQLSAVSALGEIGGPLAKNGLRRCLKIGDPVLEDAVREALDNIQAMDDPLAFNPEF